MARSHFVPDKNSVEVGYTFLAKNYWGRGYNDELKKLMLDHAFQFVENIVFFVGEKNYRSQKAVQKLGALEVRKETSLHLDRELRTSIFYELKKRDWITV